MNQEFGFHFDAAARPLLRLVGAGPDSAVVRLDDQVFDVEFGWFRVVTQRTDIAGATVTGPYRWWRAFGVRLSLADHGLTFGSSVRQGVCVRFHRPPEVRLGGRPLRLQPPGLTLTIADPAALVAALS